MNTFQICWIVAGAILGWTGISYGSAMIKAHAHLLIRVGIAFVGALVAYTLVK